MSLSLRRICPKRFHRAFRICSERGFSWHFLYSDLFVIFTGNLMFRTFFSCFRWKAFIFSSSVRVSAHVLQLYSSMDFTRDLFLLVANKYFPRYKYFWAALFPYIFPSSVYQSACFCILNNYKCLIKGKILRGDFTHLDYPILYFI